MSDDNKNLSDDLDDMIGDAKEGARRAGDKISSSAKEFSEDAKEFGRDAKERANEFSEDAKKVFSDGKNVAIIAHFTLIGWIIALVMNSSNKTEFGSFYIRQYLGFMLLSLLCVIPFVGLLVAIVLLVAWVMSLVSALGGKMAPSFLLGKQFQEWFKGI
ncbi:YtxH domain-containing protein [Psychroserpens sp. Hel_I_66]|uniref:YtxH domain-containing protein n=1 Tax=Psychroserpens sp. Hel_I_66 TaxID=1250004 RepID=UPI000646C8E3|nr:YtxH domain-containing protein [Psychroserpens sp. Hel_I_66]